MKMKINFIDIIILVVIIAGFVWFFGFRGKGGNAPVYDEEMFVITYMSPSYPDFVTSFLSVGDSIEDFIKGGNIGTITELTVSEGYDVRAGTDGILVKSPKEGYEQIEIVSEVKGRKAENGLIINGNTYLVGQYVTIRAGTGKLYIMLTGMRGKS